MRAAPTPAPRREGDAAPTHTHTTHPSTAPRRGALPEDHRRRCTLPEDPSPPHRAFPLRTDLGRARHASHQHPRTPPLTGIRTPALTSIRSPGKARSIRLPATPPPSRPRPAAVATSPFDLIPTGHTKRAPARGWGPSGRAVAARLRLRRACRGTG